MNLPKWATDITKKYFEKLEYDQTHYYDSLTEEILSSQWRRPPELPEDTEGSRNAYYLIMRHDNIPYRDSYKVIVEMVRNIDDYRYPIKAWMRIPDVNL